jgi:hypothetical protein
MFIRQWSFQCRVASQKKQFRRRRCLLALGNVESSTTGASERLLWICRDVLSTCPEERCGLGELPLRALSPPSCVTVSRTAGGGEQWFLRFTAGFGVLAQKSTMVLHDIRNQAWAQGQCGGWGGEHTGGFLSLHWIISNSEQESTWTSNHQWWICDSPCWWLPQESYHRHRVIHSLRKEPLPPSLSHDL